MTRHRSNTTAAQPVSTRQVFARSGWTLTRVDERLVQGYSVTRVAELSGMDVSVVRGRARLAGVLRRNA